MCASARPAERWQTRRAAMGNQDKLQYRSACPCVLSRAFLHSRPVLAGPLPGLSFLLLVPDLTFSLPRASLARVPTQRAQHPNQKGNIPVVNPDGYEVNWRGARNGGGMQRKNTRQVCGSSGLYSDGVDLNRNYPVCFSEPLVWHGYPGSSTNTCDEDYRGAAPFSEPETIAVRSIVSMRNFSTALNYHSFGRMINMPYSCKPKGEPKGLDGSTFQAIGQMIAMTKPTPAQNYVYGQPWTNGLYTVNGDASDWMYEEFGIFAMSPEIGPDEKQGPLTDRQGFWPSGSLIPTIGAENVMSDRLLAWYAGPFLALDDGGIACVGPAGATVRAKNSGLRPVSLDSTVQVVLSWGHLAADGNLVLDACAAASSAPEVFSARSMAAVLHVDGLPPSPPPSRRQRRLGVRTPWRGVWRCCGVQGSRACLDGDDDSLCFRCYCYSSTARENVAPHTHVRAFLTFTVLLLCLASIPLSHRQRRCTSSGDPENPLGSHS